MVSYDTFSLHACCVGHLDTLVGFLKTLANDVHELRRRRTAMANFLRSHDPVAMNARYLLEQFKHAGAV